MLAYVGICWHMPASSKTSSVDSDCISNSYGNSKSNMSKSSTNSNNHTSNSNDHNSNIVTVQVIVVDIGQVSTNAYEPTGCGTNKYIETNRIR